jgi:serine/threonine protein kinase
VDPQEPEEGEEVDPTEILASIKEHIVSTDDFMPTKTLGRGAYGEVLLATHRRTNRQVAVKRFLLDELKGPLLMYFCREVLILQSCANFFLLPFLGFSATSPYVIVTEYITGGSLYESLQKKPGSPRLTADEKLVAALGIARGMMALHRENIIHRDLKSLNVLLDGDHLPKVCDFGIARFMGDSNPTVTKNVGTPHWMAPEMFVGDNYTLKVDVYAFAIVLWEMLTEKIPFNGKDAFQVAIAVATNGVRPELTPKTPDPMRRFLALCWHQSPEKRPAFPQIVLKLATGAISFTAAPRATLADFLRKYRFTPQEAKDMNSPTADWSEEFEEEFPTPPGCDLNQFVGGINVVDCANRPLNPTEEPAALSHERAPEVVKLVPVSAEVIRQNRAPEVDDKTPLRKHATPHTAKARPSDAAAWRPRARSPRPPPRRTYSCAASAASGRPRPCTTGTGRR